MNAIIPIPRCSVSVRPATMADFPFIDELQKMHQPMLGWTPRQTIEGKIAAGHVLIAEERDEETERRRDEVKGAGAGGDSAHSVSSSLRLSVSTPVGYCISQDRYMGREEVGVVYQLNVRPGRHRHLVGATLVKTIFDRAAYGCKLFCCWCAQDIEANYFWEAMGFVPLAFRAGNRKKARVHIFWQRRVRDGDTTTPYWFPSETRGGMMNEARLVLPIPPGTHWKDEMPRVLPDEPRALASGPPLPDGRGSLGARSRKSKIANKPMPRRVRLGAPPSQPQADAVTVRVGEKPKRATRERVPRQKAKNDPKLVAAARELRDRWLEKINDDPSLLLSEGKYQVSRQLIAPVEPIKRLPTAA